MALMYKSLDKFVKILTLRLKILTYQAKRTTSEGKTLGF